MDKKLPESKLVWDIQVFLGFANFYWQFIQSYSKIIALLTSMLKITRLPEVSESTLGNDDGKVLKIGIGGSGEELAKKLGKLSKSLKLFKSGNSKGKKPAKFKKPSKIEIHLIPTLRKPAQAF